MTDLPLVSDLDIGDLKKWSKQCHAASLELVRTGAIPRARVARGHHPVVKLHQHSWVAVGDPYKPEAVYDPTLWSYMSAWVEPKIVRHVAGTAEIAQYVPHGAQGHIISHGPPPPLVGEAIVLDVEWSDEAEAFFTMIGYHLDVRGWHHLAHAPVTGWPAKEIITAMYRDERLTALIPIDIVGMVTDENPGGLYW